MVNFPLIDLSVMALVVALTLILALYHRRKAVAIEQIRNLAEAFSAAWRRWWCRYWLGQVLLCY